MAKRKSFNNSSLFNKGDFTKYLTLAVITASVVIGVSLVKKNQNIEERAAVPGGIADISIEPISGNFQPGSPIVSTIKFSSAGTPISGVAARLIYKYDGDYSNLNIQEIKINPNLTSSGEWVCPTQTAHIASDSLSVDIACANISSVGFIANNTELVDITVSVENNIQDPKILTIFFDPSLSVITAKSNNQDILAIPTTTAVYNIENNTTVNNPGNKECVIKMYPASTNLPYGSELSVKAEVNGSKVTSIAFNSSNPDYVSITPELDKKFPYQTTIKPSKFFTEGVVYVTAKAYLGSNELCSGTTVVTRMPVYPTLPPRFTPTPTKTLYYSSPTGTQRPTSTPTIFRISPTVIPQ